MGAELNYRSVALETFVNKKPLLIDIPKVQDIQSIMIRVEGELVIGTAAALSVPTESPCPLVQRASWVAGGKDVLHDVGFTELSLGNYERDWVNLNTKPGTAVATHKVKLIGFMDRVNFDGPRPKDSSFQAYLTNLLQLRLTFGDFNDIVVPDVTTVLSFTGTVEVLVDSVEEVTGDKGEIKFVRKVTEQSKPFTGANKGMSFDLPIGNHIRNVLVHATDGGVPNDNLVNDLTLAIDDTDIRYKASWGATRDKNMSDKKISSMPAGFAVIDSTPEGKLPDTYDLTAADTCRLKADVNAPAMQGLLTVVINEFIFPAG